MKLYQGYINEYLRGQEKLEGIKDTVGAVRDCKGVSKKHKRLLRPKLKEVDEDLG
jgi:hypothetical protein